MKLCGTAEEKKSMYERVIPAHKTELYANSFIPSTTQLWNTLPETILQVNQPAEKIFVNK